MKLHAQAYPYSSIVGGGLTLLDEKGAARFMVSFRGATAGITKEETEAISKQFLTFIADHGIDVPDRQPA